MVSLAVLSLALATLCWPTRPGVNRLRGIVTADARPRGRPRLPRPTTLLVVIAVGSVGWPLAGPGAALAGALAAGTMWRRWTARRATQRALAAVDGLAEALRSVVAELRAGAHPAIAAETAAVDAEPQAARAMRAVAAAARLDGDVARALATSGAATTATAPVLGQLSQAWTLVQRHGLPLAEVLDAVRSDLETRGRFTRQLLARMAGPRASATVLALLPVLGVALGEAMGARPLHVLTATLTGHGLLVVGVALACAGVAWSARITDRVVLR